MWVNATLPTSRRTSNYVDECYVASSLTISKYVGDATLGVGWAGVEQQ